MWLHLLVQMCTLAPLCVLYFCVYYIFIIFQNFITPLSYTLLSVVSCPLLTVTWYSRCCTVTHMVGYHSKPLVCSMNGWQLELGGRTIQMDLIVWSVCYATNAKWTHVINGVFTRGKYQTQNWLDFGSGAGLDCREMPHTERETRTYGKSYKTPLTLKSLFPKIV